LLFLRIFNILSFSLLFTLFFFKSKVMPSLALSQITTSRPESRGGNLTRGEMTARTKAETGGGAQSDARLRDALKMRLEQASRQQTARQVCAHFTRGMCVFSPVIL
jgi:hypothetical protein